MSISDMLTRGRSKELSKVRAAHMEAALQQVMKVEPVNVVSARDPDRKKVWSQRRVERPRHCYGCGGPFLHKGTCPAVGKRCSNCSKLHHFAKMCRSAPACGSVPGSSGQVYVAAQLPTEGEDMDDDVDGAIHVIHAMQPGGHARKGIPKCHVMVDGHSVPALIDTGASINVMAHSMMLHCRFLPF